MPYRVFQKVFKDKDQTEQFKIVSWLFVVSLVVLLLTVGYFLTKGSQKAIEKSESAIVACEAVQDNNQILRNYLFETEDRGIQRIEQENREDKTPLYSKKELEESYKPLIDSLKRQNCNKDK